jgi:dsDNA-binding SOS-regulon protein
VLATAVADELFERGCVLVQMKQSEALGILLRRQRAKLSSTLAR